MKNRNKMNKKLIALPLIAALLLILTAATWKGEHFPGKDGNIYGETIHCNYDKIVLIIAGSGPTDRNGNTPILKGRNDSLKLLAEELEKKGISTFRYDKRTAGISRKSYLNHDIRFDDFISDAISAVEYLKEEGYEKIYLLGHSQGSLIAFEAACELEVDGLISVCGPSESIDAVLEKQLGNAFKQDSIEIKVINNLREEKITTEGVENIPMFNVENQKFLLSWIEYSPVESIKDVNCPLILIGGTMDSQVSTEDIEKLLIANPESDSMVIHGMNHVLKVVSSEKEDIKTYTDPSYPVSKELIQAVARFVE
ncbi:hypothetical protein SAMN02745751_02173 [Dethiosulfatibacter aminovorans DSM 17477]|uniref:Serine aminopeptidase S33 domain-containing protein n=2 Tax=Dethiosulfatibacter TaxID=448125 RepID=A0A1M6I153_9FIRM|nr:hypothetical protein SAMN02745751_02173 [Dethiosulfatibacter aminovorans DSM 17477]